MSTPVPIAHVEIELSGTPTHAIIVADHYDGGSNALLFVSHERRIIGEASVNLSEFGLEPRDDKHVFIGERVMSKSLVSLNILEESTHSVAFGDDGQTASEHRYTDAALSRIGGFSEKYAMVARNPLTGKAESIVPHDTLHDAIVSAQAVDGDVVSHTVGPWTPQSESVPDGKYEYAFMYQSIGAEGPVLSEDVGRSAAENLEMAQSYAAVGAAVTALARTIGPWKNVSKQAIDAELHRIQEEQDAEVAKAMDSLDDEFSKFFGGDDQ